MEPSTEEGRDIKNWIWVFSIDDGATKGPSNWHLNVIP